MKKNKTNSYLLFITMMIQLTAYTSSASCNNATEHKLDTSHATATGIQKIVDGNKQFALELYHQLSKTETGNLFYSPYSLSTALAMTYEGSSGKTAEEIQKVFHFPKPQTLRENFAAIQSEITNTKNHSYELKSSNDLWIQKDYPLLKNYLEILKKYYSGQATNMDFILNPENSRQTINNAIAKQTNQKIPDLIPPDMINPMTRLILTNAIYFKANWQWPFDQKKTQKEDFKISTAKTVKVPMMSTKPQNIQFNYTENKDLQILELPYEGGKISMLILLPRESLEKLPHLNAEKLATYQKQMSKTKLDSILIPKFELDSRYSLKETLKAMGVSDPFTSNKADFSKMTDAEKLYLAEIVHQAYIKVDETGTEATAATGASSAALSIPVTRNIVFKADHPFIFIIQENNTGNILFLGRVTNPNA